MVFTSDGVGVRVRVRVGVGVVIRSAERYDLVKIKMSESEADSAYDSVDYDPVKTALSESEAEAEDKPITILDSKHYDWLVLQLLLPTPTI